MKLTMCDQLRCLTVAQPWAWSIMHAGKDVENRTQLWKYRGPVAIHAGNRWSERGSEVRAYQDAMARETSRVRHRVDLRGVVIGVVQLVDVHPAMPGCCVSPWAEYSYLEAGGKRTRRDVIHLVHTDVTPLEPIRAGGRLGLWRPDHDLQYEIVRQLEQVA